MRNSIRNSIRNIRARRAKLALARAELAYTIDNSPAHSSDVSFARWMVAHHKGRLPVWARF